MKKRSIRKKVSSKKLVRKYKKSERSDASRAIQAASLRGNLARWRPSSETIEQELRSGKRGLIRRRCKEVVENSSLLSGERREFVSDLVGEGIRINFSARPRRIENRLQNLWDSWVDLPWSYDEEENLNGLVKLCLSEVFVSGEVFLRKIPDPQTGYKYQVIPAHQLNESAVSASIEGDNIFSEGIEYDLRGRKAAYHFYRNSPDPLQVSLNLESVRVEASEIHHIYLRSGSERRGLPIILPVIVKSRFLEDLAGATLRKQLIASCFAAFVHDISSEASNEEISETEQEEIEPGTITDLPINRTVSFPNPPTNSDYADLQKNVKQDIAKALGTSYEALSSDYSEVNFSSARQGHQRKLRHMRVYRDFLLKDAIMRPIVSDFLEAIQTQGILNFNLRPTWEMLVQKDIIVDPAREIPAVISELRNGLVSWKDIIALRGKNPDQFLERLRRERDQLQDLNFEFLDIENAIREMDASNSNDSGNSNSSSSSSNSSS